MLSIWCADIPFGSTGEVKGSGGRSLGGRIVLPFHEEGRTNGCFDGVPSNKNKLQNEPCEFAVIGVSEASS
jgi:hypothetical protein